MADQVILVDTSILIDYYRKSDKENSIWINLLRRKYSFAISVVTKYEIYSGAKANQTFFWDSILQAITIIPLDEISVDSAVTINTALKDKENKSI